MPIQNWLIISGYQLCEKLLFRSHAVAKQRLLLVHLMHPLLEFAQFFLHNFRRIFMIRYQSLSHFLLLLQVFNKIPCQTQLPHRPCFRYQTCQRFSARFRDFTPIIEFLFDLPLLLTPPLPLNHFPCYSQLLLKNHIIWVQKNDISMQSPDKSGRATERAEAGVWAL